MPEPFSIYALVTSRPLTESDFRPVGVSYYCTIYLTPDKYLSIVALPSKTPSSVVWDKFTALGFYSYVQISSTIGNPFLPEPYEVV